MDTFKAMSIEQVGKHLGEKGVSSDALQRLADNKVSGLALLLIEESELKEMVPAIGDRAILRNLLKDLKVIFIINITHCNGYIAICYNRKKSHIRVNQC